ncbi:ABC transporter permease [Micromonospora sp. NPDC023956]|uniref:ABC transporter permease n=1 Tax=Micromonospora sp. NPDC023956 TaxID=3155722 RepID=UPI0033C028D5
MTTADRRQTGTGHADTQAGRSGGDAVRAGTDAGRGSDGTRRPTATIGPPARFRDLVAAEWIKLWSLRSTWGALGLILLTTVGLAVHASLDSRRQWADWPADRRNLLNPLWDAFPQEAQLFVVLAASSVGAVAIGGEYASGLFRATFAAVPARGSVAAAKLVVLTAATTLLGLVGSATAFGISQAILAGKGGMSVGEPGALRAIVASALLVPLCTLIGAGLGALVRHTAPAIVTAATVLLLLPTAIDEDERWTALIRHAMPVPAWDRLLQPAEPPPWVDVAHRASVGGAWTTYAGWAVLATLVTVLVVRRREP